MQLAKRLDKLGTETAFAVSAEAAAFVAKGNTVYPFHLGDMTGPGCTIYIPCPYAYLPSSAGERLRDPYLRLWFFKNIIELHRQIKFKKNIS